MDIRTPAMSWRVLSAAALVVAALARHAGYWFGASRHGAFEVVGSAHSTAARIGVEAENWSYSVPLDVRWTDAKGDNMKANVRSVCRRRPPPCVEFGSRVCRLRLADCASARWSGSL